MKRTAPALLLLCTILTEPALVAAPIRFNTALPVARQAFVLREQAVARRFNDDSSSLDRDLGVHAASFLYGVLEMTLVDQKKSREGKERPEFRRNYSIPYAGHSVCDIQIYPGGGGATAGDSESSR